MIMVNIGYEILQYSVCDGWVNNLLDGEKNPYVFATLAEAVAELQEEFEDWNAEIQAGDRDKDDGYDISTFQIKCAATGKLYELDLLEGKVAVSVLGKTINSSSLVARFGVGNCEAT